MMLHLSSAPLIRNQNQLMQKQQHSAAQNKGLIFTIF